MCVCVYVRVCVRTYVPQCGTQRLAPPKGIGRDTAMKSDVS